MGKNEKGKYLFPKNTEMDYFKPANHSLPVCPKHGKESIVFVKGKKREFIQCWAQDQEKDKFIFCGTTFSAVGVSERDAKNITVYL
jgi:hypothetical protein